MKAPPLSVPPYLRCGKWMTGWCSEGGRDTGDNGKNISSSSPVLAVGCSALRCGLHIRTAAADSQQERIRGGSGRGEKQALSAAQGAMTASLFSQAGRQAAGSKLRGANTVSARLRFGRSLRVCGRVV